jgi:hypothetical protein
MAVMANAGNPVTALNPTMAANACWSTSPSGTTSRAAQNHRVIENGAFSADDNSDEPRVTPSALADK